MVISILLEPSDVKGKPGSAQYISTCLKLPYVWAMPYTLRDSFKFATRADQCMRSNWIVVTGPIGLAALESLGLHIRDNKCSYDALLSASVMMAGGQRVVVAPTLKDMRTYGRTMRFLYRRAMDRLLRPTTFFTPPEFHHTHIANGMQEHYMDVFAGYAGDAAGAKPVFMSVDLETTKLMQTVHNGVTRNWGAVITLAGYTFAFYSKSTGWYFETYTQEFANESDYRLLSQVMSSPLHKTMHNGQYDSTYFARWNILCNRYTHDTQDWFKSVTPHLKKKSRGKDTKGFYSLQAVSNLYLTDSTYWKDGRNTTGAQYQRYCAMDCHRTASIAVAQLLATTKETFNNYCLTAWLRPVCQVAGLRGMRIDEKARAAARESYLDRNRKATEWVYAVAGCSPNQSDKLLPIMQAISQYALTHKLVGARLIEDTSKESLRDISDWHPLFAILADTIREARQTAKWLSTYILKPGWSAATHNGGTGAAGSGWGPAGDYLVYKLDPFGSDSRRLSSSASNLWSGYNGQNVPGDLRKMFVGYPGCGLASSDLSAAETRTTAYLARCNNMREAVEGDSDFHAANSEFFFGIPYAEIFDDATGATINKVVRNLGKKINHAANYLMGVRVFIENSGIRTILKMQDLLKLPGDWTPPQVVKHVLDKFDARFPEVRNQWANEQAIEVLKTGRLQCITGYKPLFIESPMHSKSVLNQCVATESQHLSAQIALRIFHNIWLAEQQHPDLIYAVLQIHDESMFGYLAPADDEAHEACKLKLSAVYLEAADAELPFNFQWRDGTNAVLRIPADPPKFGKSWYDVKG